jgi:hypothetical protein
MINTRIMFKKPLRGHVKAESYLGFNERGEKIRAVPGRDSSVSKTIASFVIMEILQSHD